MRNVWCVRAEFGTYTKHFVEGGYVAIGWMPDVDLSAVKSREELYPPYRQSHPDDTSNIVIGQQVGQIARFLLEIQPGDVVITPAADTEWLHYGTVGPELSYFYAPGNEGCPYRHRRGVEWAKERLKRGVFSVPLQNTLRSSLTVFGVSQRDEFLAGVYDGDLVPKTTTPHHDPHRIVLDQVLQLDHKEFEILVSCLLTALGFERSEVTGQTGDGGVDVTGELNVRNLAKVRVFVQAKRYDLARKVSANVVKQLRQAIPHGCQGVFITTAKFQEAAEKVAVEPDFPRIGLINGHQLVDLLIEHWEDIPDEFHEKLGLKRGLVKA